MTPLITSEYPNPGDAILAKRGILKQARAAGWKAYRLKDGRLGWRIPTWTHDGKPGRPFWKAQDSVKPKYQWLEYKGREKPKLYTGAVRPDDVKRAVNREGVLVVTGGQPALLTFQVTGRDNAVCCFGEGIQHLPTADHMRQWVSAGDLILHIPDRDETGDRQTVALAALAAEIGCAYARIELPDYWAGYDLNDALMQCLETGDDFSASLSAYELIHAPAAIPEPSPATQQGRAEPRQRTESGDRYHATRTHLLNQLRADTPRGLKAIRCPHPNHDDKHPSAQIGHSQVTCHSRGCHHDWRGMWDGIAQRCGYANFIDAVHQTQPRPLPPALPETYLPGSLCRTLFKQGQGRTAHTIALLGGLGTEPRIITKIEAHDIMQKAKQKATGKKGDVNTRTRYLNEMQTNIETALKMTGSEYLSVALSGNRGAAPPLANGSTAELNMGFALRGQGVNNPSPTQEYNTASKTHIKLPDVPKKRRRPGKVYILPTRADMCMAYGVTDNRQWLSGDVPVKYRDYCNAMISRWVKVVTRGGGDVTCRAIEREFGLPASYAKRSLRQLSKGDNPTLIKRDGGFKSQTITRLDQVTRWRPFCDFMYADGHSCQPVNMETAARWLADGLPVTIEFKLADRFIHADNVKADNSILSLEDVTPPVNSDTYRNSKPAVQRNRAAGTDYQPPAETLLYAAVSLASDEISAALLDDPLLQFATELGGVVTVGHRTAPELVERTAADATRKAG